MKFYIVKDDLILCCESINQSMSESSLWRSGKILSTTWIVAPSVIRWRWQNNILEPLIVGQGNHLQLKEYEKLLAWFEPTKSQIQKHLILEYQSTLFFTGSHRLPANNFFFTLENWVFVSYIGSSLVLFFSLAPLF